MDIEQLSKEELIEMVNQQADDIAALQLENAWLKEQQHKQELPVREQLQQNPVEVDGVLWYFKKARFVIKGKTYTAQEAMLNEPLLRSILANPYQMILKKYY